MDFPHFASFVLAFALHHGHAADELRVDRVSFDLWNAAHANPVFCGDQGHAGTALALLAVAEHESGLWEKVQDCSVCYRGSKWCGAGAAITLFQLEGPVAWGGHTREQLCSNNRLAADMALRVLHRHKRADSPLRMFRGYAHGGRKAAGQEMHDIFAPLAFRAGITVRYRNGCMEATLTGG